MDFLEQCQKYIDATAVDDRRHDEFTGNDVVTHLATAMSINDFHKKLLNLVQKILLFHQCSGFACNFDPEGFCHQTER